MTNLLNFGLIFQDMHIFRLFMLSRYDWFILILVVIVLQHCCNKKKSTVTHISEFSSYLKVDKSQRDA